MWIVSNYSLAFRSDASEKLALCSKVMTCGFLKTSYKENDDCVIPGLQIHGDKYTMVT